VRRMVIGFFTRRIGEFLQYSTGRDGTSFT
jgi:hypothetical protein